MSFFEFLNRFATRLVVRGLVLCVFLLSFSALSWASPQVHPWDKLKTRDFPFSQNLIIRQKERTDTEPINELLAALGIKKGMIILDIGAGSGQYTYKFAKALQGTGKIFATDIDPKAINYIKREVKKKGYNNVYPVLVNRTGVDSFYGTNRYDLIFLSHSFHLIPDKVAYFNQLRNYLKAGGHLAVLEVKRFEKFNPDDFTDVKGILKEILHESKDSPFYKYFQPILSLTSEGSESDLKSLLALCFNRMAADPHFFVPFLQKNKLALKESLFPRPEERCFLNGFLWILSEYGVLDPQKGVDIESKNMDRFNYGRMRVINQSIIIQSFRRYLDGDRNPFWPGGKFPNEKKYVESVEWVLRKAGYAVSGEYDFIPHHLLWIYYAGADK